MGLDCSYLYLGSGKIRERGIAVFREETFIDIAGDRDEMMEMLGISQYTFIACRDTELTNWLCSDEAEAFLHLPFRTGLEQFALAVGVRLEDRNLA